MQFLSDDEGPVDEAEMDDDGDSDAEDAAVGLGTDAPHGDLEAEPADDLADDLEDTEADPARGVASGSRRPVERPDTDGAPVIAEPPPETAPVHEDPDHPEAFGRWLRSQREMRGIHLRAIAESSKIGLGHLKALESGRFDLLPADVFTKGFLRQYAGYVGLDPEEAINFYLAAREHVEEEEDPLSVAPPPKESGTRWVVVAVLLAAALLAVIWGLSRLSESSDDAELVPSGTTEAPDRSVGDASNLGSSSSASPPASSDPAGTTANSGVNDRANDSVDDGTDPAAAASIADEEPTPTRPTAPAQSVQPADVPLRIVLDFSDTCWVSALIDDTETREKVHAQGESLTLDARSSVELKVGNYRAVEVEVNGMPYDLGSRGRSGSVVRTVLIDLESVRQLRGEV